MNGEDWDGQAVRTRDGPLLGVVVGVFPQGPPRGTAAGARRLPPVDNVGKHRC
jgi:hypothetical protein